MLNQFFEMWNGLTHNEHIRVAFIAMILAQALKILFYYLKFRKINFRVFIQPSGMPSSHTAMVMALTTSVGIVEGWSSVMFAVSLIFSIIVMYDAAGVRRAAGKQARVLNIMMEELFTKKHINEYRLKELLGHTPVEVFFGCILGIFLAFFFQVYY